MRKKFIFSLLLAVFLVIFFAVGAKMFLNYASLYGDSRINTIRLSSQKEAILANGQLEERVKKAVADYYNLIFGLGTMVLRIKSDTQEIDRIRARNFKLLGEPDTLTFGDAVDMANLVAKRVDIRPAFLLAIFQEELKLEKFDMCYLTDLTTGEGFRISTGEKLFKVMKPDRDIPHFLDIMKELGKNPTETAVTCPMSFGWGGAMGPSDFIPSTWIEYKNKIEKITGKQANPWNIQDAFWAAGLYLSDSGANTQTRAGEWNAAMVYFSGSINSPYTWYADGTMAFADEFQGDIEILERRK